MKLLDADGLVTRLFLMREVLQGALDLHQQRWFAAKLLTFNEEGGPAAEGYDDKHEESSVLVGHWLRAHSLIAEARASTDDTARANTLAHANAVVQVLEDIYNRVWQGNYP